MNEMNHDPARDPQLADALRTYGEPPAAEVNWQALRSSINERAELPLARRRHERKQKSQVRWLRPLVPLAAAAGVALALGLNVIGSGPDAEPQDGTQATGIRPLVEEVLGAQISESEFDLLFGGSSTDALLLAAASSGESATQRGAAGQGLN